MKPIDPPLPCYVCMQSWAGITTHAGEVVGETDHYYSVRFRDESFGQPAGRVRRVLKRHVRGLPSKCTNKCGCECPACVKARSGHPGMDEFHQHFDLGNHHVDCTCEHCAANPVSGTDPDSQNPL